MFDLPFQVWSIKTRLILFFLIYDRTCEWLFYKKEGSYMGYARQTALADAYICDTKEDLNLLPHSIMGSTCWVISENLEYICNSKNKWLPKYNK
jgi:hypothetical protein